MNPDHQRPTPEGPRHERPSDASEEGHPQETPLPQDEKPVIGPDGRWTKSFAELTADLVGWEGAPPDLSYNPAHMRNFGK